MAGPGELFAARLIVEAEARHGPPVVADIARGAPEIAARGRAPFADVLPSVLAQAENHRPLRGAQREPHLLIRRFQLVGMVDLRRAAPIVFQVIDAPRRPRLRVLLFMPVAGKITGAGAGTGAGINPELEALRVDVIGQRLHVGKFFVGGDVAVFIALFGFPGVVDIDVDIAGVAHAAGCDGVGHAAHGGVVHFAGELVPTVPAHGRSLRVAVRGDRFERRQRLVRQGGRDFVFGVLGDLLEHGGALRSAPTPARTQGPAD